MEEWLPARDSDGSDGGGGGGGIALLAAALALAPIIGPVDALTWFSARVVESASEIEWKYIPACWSVLESSSCFFALGRVNSGLRGLG
jgi:hypothetical protein